MKVTTMLSTLALVASALAGNARRGDGYAEPTKKDCSCTKTKIPRTTYLELETPAPKPLETYVPEAPAPAPEVPTPVSESSRVSTSAAETEASTYILSNAVNPSVYTLSNTVSAPAVPIFTLSNLVLPTPAYVTPETVVTPTPMGSPNTPAPTYLASNTVLHPSRTLSPAPSTPVYTGAAAIIPAALPGNGVYGALLAALAFFLV